MENMRRVKSLRNWTAARVGRVTFAVVAVLPALVISAATSAPQRGTTSRTEGYVEALASEALEGRLTGTIGAQRAADYIIDELRKIGVPSNHTQRTAGGFVLAVSVIDEHNVQVFEGQGCPLRGCFHQERKVLEKRIPGERFGHSFMNLRV